MKTKIRLLVIMLAVCYIYPHFVFSQNFSRVLELDARRMNGPKTEEVIKTIQKFAGFEENGKVDRPLWNFIFVNDSFNIQYMRLIQIVAQYKPNEMRKIENRLSYDYWGSLGYDFTIYFANDGKNCIL